MGTFDSAFDTPGRLREENDTIVLKFERTGPDTAKVSWNIPKTTFGCGDSNFSGVYDGIVITVGNQQALPENAPKNGTIYNPDPTLDSDVHAGDKINGNLIIGAFYHDKSTNSLTVTGYSPDIAYYVQAYIVDAQYRYEPTGIFSYEQSAHAGNITKDTPAHQIIGLRATPTSTSYGVNPSTATNLVIGTTYEFVVTVGFPPNQNSYTISVKGEDALTYGDLVNAINNKFLLLENPTQLPFPPNTNTYYWNNTTQKLYLWDGNQNISLPVIIEPTDPSILSTGSIWVNTLTNVISVWNGASWVINNPIEYPTNPRNPLSQDFWFNGTSAYVWEGNTWCSTQVYNQINDPCNVDLPIHGSYWYNTVVEGLFKWDNLSQMWLSISAIYWFNDPNALLNNTFWFNSTTNLLYVRNGSAWDTATPLTVSTTQPSVMAANIYWYNPSTEELKQRNSLNTSWSVLPVLVWADDPTNRDSCDFWWDSTTDTLKIWDSINSQWITVTHFTQSGVDPRTCPTINIGSLWYNPDTKLMVKWDGNDWISVTYINSTTNPLTLGIGTLWHNTTSNTWNSWNGSAWDIINPIQAASDPAALPTGTYWYNSTTNILSQRNGLLWMPINYSTSSLIPSVGSLWYNTVTNQLLSWDGTQWANGVPLLSSFLNTDGNLKLVTRDVGSSAQLIITSTGDTLFNTLGATFGSSIYGTDGVDPSQPSYMTDGDDWTSDEIKTIHHQVKMQLGYPVVDVELTPAQINVCLNNAIQSLRKRSAIAYRRQFFFIDVQPGIQKYILSNKRVGNNKIVDVMSLHRITSSFLSSAHGAGLYGQVILQHLYNMGTFDMVSYELVGEYVNTLEVMFGTRLTFVWNESQRELMIPYSFSFGERILVDAMVERTMQDMMSDRWLANWIQKFTLAQSMQILAQIRGKYATLPGAGGGISLNAGELQAQGDAMLEALLQQVEDYLVDDPAAVGMGSTFIWG